MTPEVKDANKTNRKNAIQKTCPIGIDAKTAGNVINISPGPSPASKPKAKTAGIVAKPDSNAARVANIGMETAELNRFSF